MTPDSPRHRYIALFWPTALTAAMLALTVLIFSGVKLFGISHITHPPAPQSSPAAAIDHAPPAPVPPADAASPAGATADQSGMIFNYPLSICIAVAMTLLSVAWLVCKLIDVFFWQAVVQRRLGQAPPRLLVDVLRMIVLIVFAGVIVLVLFGTQFVTGLLLSSGVVGIVLGFALQRMIGDFFGGIALNVEHPFRIGDWIEVNGTAGKVTEMNWRATHLITLDNVLVVMPNSFITERSLSNYNRPTTGFRTEISVALEYSVQVRDAKRVLLAAIMDAPGVLPEPRPDVIVKEFGNDGVVYRCRFYLATYADHNIVPDIVATHISEHMWQAGMGVPYPKRDIYHARMPPREVDRRAQKYVLLERVDLFSSLSVDQIAELAGKLTERHFGPGQDVVTQGEAGDSLFVVVDGLLDVKVASGGLAPRKVAKLGPGQFFGEMSLLTGEKRSATVSAVTEVTVYELSKDDLVEFLKTRTVLLDKLGTALADRRMRTDAALAAKATVQHQTQQRNLAEDLIGKIRYYLGLS